MTSQRHIYPLNSLLSEDQITNLYRKLNERWNYCIPGGFVHNTPNRKVNAFGDGCPINSDGENYGVGYPTTYWTAAISQNSVSLATDTERMPNEFSSIVPSLRRLFVKCYPDAQVTDYTFTIGVANYYTQPTMNIAAHTDDNIWYPRESGAGPVFASLTFYPDGPPSCPEGFARFQIKDAETGKWITLPLPHRSVLILPSNTPHRVLPTLKRHLHLFRPRINITFRSTYPKNENALLHAMCVANHTRYYRIPKTIMYPHTMDDITIGIIWDTYNQCCLAHGYTSIECLTLNNDDIQYYRSLRDIYRKQTTRTGNTPIKLTPNIVGQLLELIIST